MGKIDKQKAEGFIYVKRWDGYEMREYTEDNVCKAFQDDNEIIVSYHTKVY